MNGYSGLIKKLETAKGCPELNGYTDALDEAMDIIHDYEKMAAECGRMTELYETAKTPISRGNGAMPLYQCPTCNKRVSERHTHCHWCGQKIEWDVLKRKGGRRRCRN